jgi:hypothetical protein
MKHPYAIASLRRAITKNEIESGIRLKMAENARDPETENLYLDQAKKTITLRQRLVRTLATLMQKE